MATPNQILTAYQKRVAVVRDATIASVTALWDGLPDYRDGNIDGFVGRVVPRVRAGQIKTAQLTDAYFRQAAAARGENVPMALLPRDEIAAVRKVDPEVEFRRPAVTLYTELSKGAPLAVGVAAGAARLASLVSTDVQLAKTTQAQASMRAGGFTYYRRVLTGNENCALCTIASTQRYFVADLMPIHPGCDCGQETVTSDWEPPQVIDRDTLEQAHGDVENFLGDFDRSGRSPNYKELIITHENGEWGPTLSWLSDRFTGPAQLG